MNKLDLLSEEKEDLEKAELCLQEALKILSPIRDSEYYTAISLQKKLMSKQLISINEDIKKTKESFDGLGVTETKLGNILSAKNKDGKDVFLRVGFLQNRVKGSNFNDAFIFDWVDKIEEGCFMIFEDYSTSKAEFNADVFRTVYTYYKKNKNLEESIKPKSHKLREVEKEINHNYLFKSL